MNLTQLGWQHVWLQIPQLILIHINIKKLGFFLVPCYAFLKIFHSIYIIYYILYIIYIINLLAHSLVIDTAQCIHFSPLSTKCWPGVRRCIHRLTLEDSSIIYSYSAYILLMAASYSEISSYFMVYLNTLILHKKK